MLDRRKRKMHKAGVPARQTNHTDQSHTDSATQLRLIVWQRCWHYHQKLVSCAGMQCSEAHTLPLLDSMESSSRGARAAEELPSAPATYKVPTKWNMPHWTLEKRVKTCLGGCRVVLSWRLTCRLDAGSHVLPQWCLSASSVCSISHLQSRRAPAETMHARAHTLPTTHT